MTPLPNQYIDKLILSFARAEWRKVAMIISRVMRTCIDEGVQIEAPRVAVRIRALVKQGQLQLQGNISKWCASEVRLPSDEPFGPELR